MLPGAAVHVLAEHAADHAALLVAGKDPPRVSVGSLAPVRNFTPKRQVSRRVTRLPAGASNPTPPGQKPCVARGSSGLD